MKLLAHITLYAVLGYLLGNMGYDVSTWQYWAVLGLTAGIDLKSHIDATA